MIRPSHLPDFDNPPLDEVVVGVQFSPLSRFTTLALRDVWDLFRNEFPKVEEQPPLEPKFETFGGPNVQPSMTFHIGSPIGNNRFWFISDDDSHLIQFQRDRLLLNWRRRPNGRAYPRFDQIAASLIIYLQKLNELSLEKFDQNLEINQAEVSYINIIEVDDFSKTDEIIKIYIPNIDVEALSFGFVDVIRNEDHKPFARLFQELNSVFSADGRQKAARLNLTFRGRPDDASIMAAHNFLEKAREAIVIRFRDITTDMAHQMWGMR